jgi:hypothetical protein
MSENTVVNLLDVEDSAPKFGMPAGLSARFCREALGLEKVGVAHFKLAADTSVPFGHSHSAGPESDEVYVVVNGTAQIKIGDDVIELAQWDAVRVPGEAMRALRGGPDGAEVLALGGRTPDFEMDQEFWTD